jgi:hypothetical protein
MLTLLKKQAGQTQLFKVYFARCQTVLSLLRVRNPSAGTLKSWSTVEAISLDEVVALTKEEQERLGLEIKPRRSAATTRRGNRQLAPHGKK